MMKNNSFLKRMWVAFVNIGAEDGYKFEDLIDNEATDDSPIYIGAIAYAIVKSDDIGTAIKLIYAGFAEKHFTIKEFFKIENLFTLVKNKNARALDIKNAEWLNKSAYVFNISGRIWPYVEE